MPRKTLTFTLAFAVALLCISAVSLGTATSARAQTVLKGTEATSMTVWAQDPTAPVGFLATKLHTQMLRLNVPWKSLEPQRNTYNQPNLDRLAAAIRAAASDGLQVIVTLYGTPAWATDRTLWGYVPSGWTPGVSHSFYPPAADRLDDFQAFATKLSSTFAGDVTGYECRNEPNLWSGLYPQQTPSDPAFGVRRYAAMLTAFSKGVRAGDPHALVIAGATGPHGQNTILSTSPQRFASLLKTMVPSSVFDAYSHHPYTIGGAHHIAPEGLPNDPAHAVSLGNISTLLKIFPDKPFYLTEYGYYTRYCVYFGLYVSQITQASYLTRAYKYAARFPQIKALVWYPYLDIRTKDPSHGNYSGLVTPSGALKRSWYAFSGGNSLTLVASKPRDASVRLSGLLTSASLGGLHNKALVLYRKTAGHAWHVARNLTTGANGSYHATVSLAGRTYFRVAWLGVVSSQTLSVKR
jgi:hypothetical protein